MYKFSLYPYIHIQNMKQHIADIHHREEDQFHAERYEGNEPFATVSRLLVVYLVFFSTRQLMFSFHRSLNVRSRIN